MISDAHQGLTNAIRRMLQGSCWRRTARCAALSSLCRVHHRSAEGFAYARNLLQTVPKAHQEMVAAALRSVFAQQSKEAVLEQWDQVSAMLAAKFPRAAELMAKASEDVLAFRHFPSQHKKKVWSTNLLERVNEEIKRRTRVVGIFPNDAAIERLVGAVLLEQDEHWQLEGRRMVSTDSMSAIPSLEDLPALLSARGPAAETARPRSTP